MKASNFATPRSMSECQFIPSADPIERPPHRGVPVAAVVCYAAIVLLVFVAVAIKVAA